MNLKNIFQVRFTLACLFLAIVGLSACSSNNDDCISRDSFGNCVGITGVNNGTLVTCSNVNGQCLASNGQNQFCGIVNGQCVNINNNNNTNICATNPAFCTGGNNGGIYNGGGSNDHLCRITTYGQCLSTAPQYGYCIASTYGCSFLPHTSSGGYGGNNYYGGRHY